MTDDEKLMKQALEALKSIAWPKGSVVFLTITALRERLAQPEGCQCPACKATPHTSDCAVHNEPAYPKGACNCVAQLEQKPVAYDKTELNCFAQDLYDQKMREGKRGHYESMFHVIHQCIKKVAPPQRKPLPPQSPCEMTQAEGRMFKLGWLECEAAHGIKGEA